MFMPRKGLDSIKMVNFELWLPNYQFTHTPMIPAGILDMGTAERGFLNCISCSLTGLLVAARCEIKSLQRHHSPRQVNHPIRTLLPLAMNWSTAPLPAPKLSSKLVATHFIRRKSLGLAQAGLFNMWSSKRSTGMEDSQWMLIIIKCRMIVN